MSKKFHFGFIYLRILESGLDLSVHGFNVTKSVTVDLVEVPLTVGGKDGVIKAVSIPEIRTKLDLKGLNKSVLAFIEKGYKLADVSLYQ